MKRAALALLVAACGSKSEDAPAPSLTCRDVVEHVATLTLRPTDYARPRIEPSPPITETDPRAFRQRRVDELIQKSCGQKTIEDRGPCARAVVLDAMETECTERGWSIERRQCLLDAKDGAAIDACGPAPAPPLPANP